MTAMDADDHRIGYEQARRLGETMRSAIIHRGDLWLQYFSIGGTISEFELDAYLNHSLRLPPLQRDLLSQAANEILADRTLPPAPFTSDLVEAVSREDRGPCSGTSPSTDATEPMDEDGPTEREP